MIFCRKSILLIAFSYVIFPLTLKAQVITEAESPLWIEMMQDPKANFFETQKAFEDYRKNREIQKGDGYKPFRRWEEYMSQRVDEFGNKPSPDHTINEYNRYFGSRDKSNVVDIKHWNEIGPVNMPSNGTSQPNGLGRVNCVAFHPTNANIIYVGAPAGGIWRSINGGLTWTVLSDTLPTLGVSSIVVDYSNPNVIYLGTGDRDAGDAPGLGVWRSTNAGLTWSVRNSGMGNRVVGKMLMHPSNPMVLLAATSGGIYKSTNSGQTWSRKSTNTVHYKDISFKPGDPTVVYASASGNFYRSSDEGESWSQITSGLPTSNRIVIGVSGANSNYVYAVLTNSATFRGLYRSTNSGLSFTMQSNSPNIMDYSANGTGTSGQAWYNLCVAVDPLNVNILYVGGVNIFKSVDGGVTWAINAHWTGSGAPAVHADHHDLVYSPLNGRLYAGNDGGIHYTTNGGNSWTELSSGLGIAQIYKIGQSALSKNVVINGYQDNGTAVYDGNWRTEIGGDGMECIVDPDDSNFMYGALYYGAIRRSSNFGISFSNIKNNITESGAWITPYILQEGNSATMIAGFNNVWYTSNVKSTPVNWTVVSNMLGGSNTQTIRVLENSPADNDILYLSRGDNKFFRSDNINQASPTYSDLTSFLPTNTWPRDVEAHPFDVNKVFIVQSNSVFQSSNKGQSWIDISGSLPNVAVNTIVYDSSSNGDLYVGTDLGVFFKGFWMTDWIPFTAGLPFAAEVTELEIYYDNNNRSNSAIRASTYGRGLWSSSLYTRPVAEFSSNKQGGCVGQVFSFIDLSKGFYHNLFWTFQGGSPANSTSTTPNVSYLLPGTYKVTLTVSNSNENDTEVKNTYIVIDSIPQLNVTPDSVTIFLGDSVTLTASGAVNYSWTPILGLSSSNNAIVRASPATTTQYTVFGQNSICAITVNKIALINVKSYVGIEENNFNGGNVRLYPNPVNDVLNIKFTGVFAGQKEISIYDLSGSIVYSEYLRHINATDLYQINTGFLKPGMYLIALRGGDEIIQMKLLSTSSQ